MNNRLICNDQEIRDPIEDECVSKSNTPVGINEVLIHGRAIDTRLIYFPPVHLTSAYRKDVLVYQGVATATRGSLH